MTNKPTRIDRVIEVVDEQFRGLGNDKSNSPVSLSDVGQFLLRPVCSDDEYRKALEAIGIACTYGTISTHPHIDVNLAFGEFVPSRIDTLADEMRICPPPLSHLSEETLQIWNEFASEDRLHPAIRARLADLLCMRGYRDLPLMTRTAINSYLEVAVDSNIAETDRALAVKRIASLGANLNFKSLLRLIFESARH